MEAFERTPRTSAVQSASSRRFTTPPTATISSADATSEPISSARASARAAMIANPPQPTMPPRLSSTPAVSPWVVDRPAAFSSRGVQLTKK